VVAPVGTETVIDELPPPPELVAKLPAVELELSVTEIGEPVACGIETVIGPDEPPAVTVCAALVNDSDCARAAH
jgi:hypothetical protein